MMDKRVGKPYGTFMALKPSRTINTLFLLSSIDGKLSTGSMDIFDIFEDIQELPETFKGTSSQDTCRHKIGWDTTSDIQEIKDGLQQYYDIERKLKNNWIMMSGRSILKTGITVASTITKTSITVSAAPPTNKSIVVIDNSYLTSGDVESLADFYRNVVVVTTNEHHPVYSLSNKNVSILYQKEQDFTEIFKELHSLHNIDKLTIQTGGAINGILLREKLIDFIDIIYAPIAVGGNSTTPMFDCESFTSLDELSKLSPLVLGECTVLSNSYLRVQYLVARRQEI
jgi:2,5-diamino-6-(ribosylamino)-4(3H)-pyrimidinone 5'-phosphate reductase